LARALHIPNHQLEGDVMDWTILWWVLAGLIVITGLLGTVLPALPGIPIMFSGLMLAAWSTGFEPVGWGTIAVLAALTAISVLIDFLASAFGAKRLGAAFSLVFPALFLVRS
jgi:uncharacterized protein YqgC (DUF456 family)